MSWGIMSSSYPPKETDLDTATIVTAAPPPHHKQSKLPTLSSSTVSSTTLNDAIARNIATNMDLPYAHEYGINSTKLSSTSTTERPPSRYYPISKHELLPNSYTPSSLVSDSVSPRSATSMTDPHHPSSFYQHHTLELPSPSSSTSSQTSKTNLSLFGSYSPSPFQLLPNLSFDSPTIFPPTPPPSAWNPFW